jgi:uncharacterized protein with PQ loop repeat
MVTCGFSTADDLGCWSGNVAAICFFFVSVPQVFLNHARRSTRGFSSLSVIIRIIGLSFHICNGLILQIPFPLMLTGVLLFIEQAIFLVQFALYNPGIVYYFFIFCPVPIFFLSSAFPETIKFTSWFQPVAQVICYIPFVVAAFRAGTTRGISLLGQHLNLCGGMFGFAMCSITGQCNPFGWMFYLVAFLQSFSVFFAACYFHEFRITDIDDRVDADAETLVNEEENAAQKEPELDEGETDRLVVELVSDSEDRVPSEGL